MLYICTVEGLNVQQHYKIPSKSLPFIQLPVAPLKWG